MPTREGREPPQAWQREGKGSKAFSFSLFLLSFAARRNNVGKNEKEEDDDHDQAEERVDIGLHGLLRVAVNEHGKRLEQVTAIEERNDERIVELVKKSAEKVIGKDQIVTHTRGMGGEDFAYFANIKPGCMFELGATTPGTKSAAGLHNSKLCIDESALDIGVNIFVQFVLDNMNGIN